MAEPLSSNTQEQMRALCKKISVAHSLDAEIRDELYGHMEDKLLAYLNGEEPVTEDDAYILVREHFGDPAVLKGLLQDVHAYEVHVSLARRLAAAFAASMIAMSSFSIFMCLVSLGYMNWIKWQGESNSGNAIFAVVSSLMLLGAAFFLYRILCYWHRRLDAGDRLWFVRWRPHFIAALLVLRYFLQKSIPCVNAARLLSISPKIGWTTLALPIYIVVGWMSPVVQCMAWLWWCDRPPRRAKAAAYAFWAWCLSYGLLTVVAPLELFITQDAARTASNTLRYLSLAQGHLSESPINWFLRWEIPGPARIQIAASMFVFAVISGLVARALYALARRIRDRHTELIDNG